MADERRVGVREGRLDRGEVGIDDDRAQRGDDPRPRTQHVVGDIEEERRLAYVGITRAQRLLTFTLASQRKQYGEILTTTPSRFLDELPQELLEWDGRKSDMTPEKSKARGKETLARLKSLFD